MALIQISCKTIDAYGNMYNSISPLYLKDINKYTRTKKKDEKKQKKTRKKEELRQSKPKL